MNVRISKRHNPDCRIDLLRDGLQGALVGHTLPATKTLRGNFRIPISGALEAISKTDCWRRFHKQAYAIHPKTVIIGKKDCEIID